MSFLDKLQEDSYTYSSLQIFQLSEEKKNKDVPGITEAQGDRFNIGLLIVEVWII